MKKLFTIDMFAVAFVSSLGCGFGEVFSRLLGWPEFVCILASIALGLGTEEVINRIALSKVVQKNPKNRAMLYGGFVLFFLLVHYMTVTRMGVSMVDYLLDEFTWVVGLPILGFVLNLLIRGLRIQKIRSFYGDGSKGFVFEM
jgi:para-nitrobenzyl esterase